MAEVTPSKSSLRRKGSAFFGLTRQGSQSEMRRVEDDEEMDQDERKYNRTQLLDQDFSEMFGTDWRARNPKKIDLSDERFKLESLGSSDGPASKRGLLNRSLHKGTLSELDVSDNRLHDLDALTVANGFQSLVIVMAKRNNIWQVDHLDLPNLVELNIAHNGLKAIPNFSRCPMLDTIILSHNRLSCTFENLRGCRRLKRIDVAYNEFMFLPSELERNLEALQGLRSLINLRLYGNPFVAIFQEYQVFVIGWLRGLEILDGVQVTRSLRQEIKELNLYALSCYDDLVRQRQRQQSLEAADNAGRRVTQPGGIPSFPRMVEKLEEVLEDGNLLQANVMFVYESAQRLQKCLCENHFPKGTIDSHFWDDVSDDIVNGRRATDDMVKKFIELATAVMERYDSIRGYLVETLGCFACVSKGNLGQSCIAILGRMIATDNEYTADVERTFREVIVPTVKRLQENDQLGKDDTVIKSLVELMKIRSLTSIVAGTLREVIPMIVAWLSSGGTHSDGDLMLLKLIAYATKDKSNIEAIATEKMVEKCIHELDNRSISENEVSRGLWLDLLTIAENLVKYGPDWVVERQRAQAVHAKLISRARSIWIVGNALDVPREAHTLAAILCYTYAAMMRRADVLRDCCEIYRLVELLCSILKHHVADPSVLGAACRCLALILRNPMECKKHIGYVVEELGKLTSLLHLLGGKRYPDLYKRALVHDSGKDNPTKEDFRKFEMESQAPLSTHKSATAADALLALVDLIEFFAEANAEDGDAREQQEIVNFYLNTAQREKLLLGLLVFDHDELSYAVMKCIGHVPLKEIEPEEMGLIIKKVADTQSISAGKIEETLARVVMQLQRLVDNNLEQGQIFRRSFAELAISETYDLLVRNTRRSTYGHREEEKQKLQLSQAAVSFLVTCSKYTSLRVYMRSKRIQDSINLMLKDEELLNSWAAPEICIERCWIGRSLEYLTSSLRGDRALDRSKKVALRVLCRIADILEGRTDGRTDYRNLGSANDNQFAVTLEEATARETAMFDRREIENSLKYMDNQEWEDRAKQIEIFVEGGGPQSVLSFLGTYKIEETQAKYQEQLLEARRHLNKIELEAAEQEKDIESKDARDRSREDPDHVNLDSIEVPYGTVPGRQLLLIAIQRTEDTAEPDTHSLFCVRPSSLDVLEGIYDDSGPEGQTISPGYILAAALRMFHALLEVPPKDECRRAVAKELRQSRCPMMLLALMEDVPPLQCHTAAKFLHVMSLVIDVNAGRTSENGGKDATSKGGTNDEHATLELLDVLSQYIRGLAVDLLHSLRQSRDASLGEAEQVLCTEVARFLSVMIAAVPHYDFSDKPEVQRDAVTKFIDWLAPDSAVRLVVNMTIHDLQLDHGAGARHGDINDMFLGGLNLARIGLKEHATEFLSSLIVRSPRHKYDVLEVFGVADAFLGQTVRLSYMAELLTAIGLGTYMLHVEEYLQKQSDNKSGRERILHASVVEAAADLLPPGQVTGVRLLVATTRKIYLLCPDEKQPPYSGSLGGGGRWDPNWESGFPRDPSIVKVHEYDDLKHIYRCFGTQICIFEWKAAQSPHLCWKLAFQGVREREAFLRCLRLGMEGKRPPVISDTQISKQLVEEMDRAGLKRDGKVLAVSVAMRHGVASVQEALVGAFAPMLFVLTEEALVEFSLSLAAWHPPKEEDFVGEHGERDTEHVLAIANGAGRQGQLALAAPSAAALPLALTGEQQTMETMEAIKNMGGYQGPVLAKSSVKNLPPREVTFDTCREPILALNFDGEPFQIRFYDDSARETWRRALASYLSHRSWTRHHV